MTKVINQMMDKIDSVSTNGSPLVQRIRAIVSILLSCTNLNKSLSLNRFIIHIFLVPLAPDNWIRNFNVEEP